MSELNQNKATTSVTALRPRVLLRATNLHKSFGGQKVLNGVSLEVREGEVIILKGDNGSGKTTLLNILTGCLEPDAGAIEYSVDPRPEVFEFPRRWWQEANPFDHFVPERVVWEGICRTWQDARLFPSQDLSANIAVARAGQIGESPINALFRYPEVQRDEVGNLDFGGALLSSLGLDSVKASSGERVSFGHAKRVALARSARTGAKVLFLDEPLAGLDDSGAANVFRALSEFSRAKGITLVIVEHVFNIPVILPLASTVWTLVGGELVSREAPDKSESRVADSTSGELFPGVPSGSWQVRSVPLYGGGVLRKASLADSVSDGPLLEVEDLVVLRRNRVVVGNQINEHRIDGLSFEVRSGELAVLQAPNGWGKTTLFEAIAGVLKPSRGTIKLNGKPIDGLPAWERAKLGISLAQSRNNFFSSLSVDESFRLSGGSEVPDGLASLRGKKMGSLSGGEKRQVALARVETSGGLFNLLDEPFEGLDQSAHQRYIHLFKPCRERGMLIALPSASVSARAAIS